MTSFRKHYFVRPDGSDDNDGSREDSSGAFRTIQTAIEAAFSVSTLPTSPVTIHLAHGAYFGRITVSGVIPARPDKNGFMILLIGDEEYPEKVQLESVGADAVRCTDGASILVAGITLRTLQAGNLFTAKRRATIAHRNCILGAAASETIYAHRYAEVYALGPTTVMGGSSAFAHATARATISFYHQTIVFGEGIHFSTYLWGVNDATVRLDKCRIIGCATGAIGVHVNGVLNVIETDGEWSGGTAPRVLDGGVIATDHALASSGKLSRLRRPGWLLHRLLGR
ncbi:MAG: hypothetical protein M3Q57_02550 [Pseudomonadota bacterium]|nr:hypothetical protein [Pseudomonadota bacterium]